MESLFRKIEAETENYYSSTKDEALWKKLGEEKQDNLRKLVIRHFIEEKTEAWVAAALALGRLAVFDVESENKLQEYMITATNIHRLRHAFTAMGSYCANLHEDRHFIFLTRYKDLERPNGNSKENRNEQDRIFNVEQLKKIIQRSHSQDIDFNEQGLRNGLTSLLIKPDAAQAANKYFGSIITGMKVTVAPARKTLADLISFMAEKQLLIESADMPFKDVVESNPTIKEWWEKENPLESQILTKKAILKKIEEKHRSGIEHLIDELEKLRYEIQQSGANLTLATVFKKLKIKNERIMSWKFRKSTFKIEDIDEWIIGSFVFAFPLAELICSKDLDVSLLLHYLIARGGTSISYVKNVPYVIGWREAHGVEWASMAETLIEAVTDSRIKNDALHFPEFLTDVAYLANHLPDDSAFKTVDLFALVKKSSLVPLLYIDRIEKIKKGETKQDAREAAILARDIINTFTDDQKWREYPQEKRNLPLLLQILFDEYIGCDVSKDIDRDYEYVLSEERKDKMLIRALKARLEDNIGLSEILIRILKDRFYTRLISIENTEDESEQLEVECRWQFLAIANILSGWNWRGTIYKDAATILCRLFESAFRTENTKLARELFYLLFYQSPEIPILKTIRAYAGEGSKLKALLDTSLFILSDLNQKNAGCKTLDDDGFDKLWEMYYEKILPLIWSVEEQRELVEYFNLWRKKKLLTSHGRSSNGLAMEDMLRYRKEFDYYAERNLTSGDISDEEEDALKSFAIRRVHVYLHNLRETHLGLETKIKAFNELYDSLSNYFEGEGLYENIIRLLNNVLEYVSESFPLIEKKLLIQSINHIKIDIDKDGLIVSHLSGVFRADDDDEAKSLLDGDSQLYYDYNITDKQRKDIIAITERFMYQRFMLGEIAAFRQKKLESPLNVNKKDQYRQSPHENTANGQPENTGNPGTSLRNSLIYNFYQKCALNIYSVALIIGIPIVLTILGSLVPINLFWGISLKEVGFGAYFMLIQFALLILIISFCLRSFWNKLCATSVDENIKIKRLDIFDLFLPKLLGMLFIAFPSMFFSDEIWTIASGASTGLTLLIGILFLIGTYMFIKNSMMKDVIKKSARNKRSMQVLSLGLLESFLISIFFTIQAGRVMGSKLRGCFDEALELFSPLEYGMFPSHMHINISEHLGKWNWLEYLFCFNFEIYPRFILFWMVQTLFIGVVLQMFITKDKIVDTD